MPPRRADLPDISLGTAFAARLAEEQSARGWTDAGLAERASKVYPMSASTIWKIKHAKPPRRVDLDEAAAIVHAFGSPSVDDFVQNRPLRLFVEFIEGPMDDLAEARKRIEKVRTSLPIADNLADNAMATALPDKHPETWIHHRLSELAGDAKKAREELAAVSNDIDAITARFRKGSRRGRA